MLINEAVEQALKAGKAIRRQNATWANFKVLPTDTTECCVLLTLRSGVAIYRGPRWNPTAKDLMADDWELVN